MKLENYVTGKWIAGDGDGQELYDAVNDTLVARATTKGLDFASILEYGRKTGNPALRKMSFHERGRMLKALALHLSAQKEKFYEISYQTGATRVDSWIDIEGGIGNLFSNASLRRKFPDLPYCSDGEPIPLSKNGRFMAQHIMVPREGVAVHINAYNFPVWGMLEKCAVNWLAGMPAVVKPATVTSYLTEAVAREIIASGIIPEGALQLICGNAGDLLEHVNSQDVVTFTGSKATGMMLKANQNILEQSVPFNMEADSLNCIVLGEGVTPGSADWEVFVKEVRKEMIVKAGQKCTAVRRIFVPENVFEDAWLAIARSLEQTAIGNPRNEKVRMGALAGKGQRSEVLEHLKKLLRSSRLVYGDMEKISLLDADPEKGAFLSPMLLVNEHPFEDDAVHQVECFGPVSTVMPYSGLDEAIALAKKGSGSLCSTIVSSNNAEARNFIVGAGTYHGRMLVLNNSNAKESTGHGSPLPMLVHGGPGRAGGGEEMGGVRGVSHYMQRVAVQGTPEAITEITQVYQQHAAGIPAVEHPFRKNYDELQVGYQLLTDERKITAEDIDAFAELSGDHFYAHKKDTDFNDTMFEKQVAHGYFILSAAAGLFVDGSDKGPVLLNYGIDELRFTKPTYAGDTIRIRFTCKEKIPQDKKEETDIPRGIVRWLVEILDGDGEVAGIGTILTMVRREE